MRPSEGVHSGFAVFLFSVCLLMLSCAQKSFKVEGRIEHAAGETLVLEHSGIVRIEAIDSVKIAKDGTYAIKADRPEYPDFYRIRIKNKSITFSVDSTETIIISGDYNNLSTGYTVENSQASELIRQLRVSLIKIQNELHALDTVKSGMEREEKVTRIFDDLERHKELARKIIMENPRSPAAYFALHQQINGQYLHSPYAEEDYPYWATVATSYHAYMPQYNRSKNIYNYVLGALKAKQDAKNQNALQELMEHGPVTGYIDMALPNRKGEEVRLSDFEGKVMLIDFSAYEAEGSVNYTFELRELYNKYHGREFEIYQVSLDRNRLLWEISTENIPWVCVRDEDGPATRYAGLYNVSQLPTTFLMDKGGNIIARNLPFSELDRRIDELTR